MKIIALTLFAAALGLAQSQSGTTAPAPKDTAKPAAPGQKSAPQNKKPAEPSKPSADQKATAQSQTQSIPAGATLVGPSLYRYTDSNGKTWNYRQTPFGVSKWEEPSASELQQNPQAKGEPVIVTDLGDSYRFARKTPFGTSAWVRKKSELTDEEKALAAGQQSRPDPNQSSVNGKPAGKL